MRQHLTSELATRWAAAVQYNFLEALAADPRIHQEEMAFHGGTSLHFSWRSPRLSEDLDFLLVRDAADIHAIVERASEKVREVFHAENPGFVVETTDKTRQGERMIAFELRVAHPDFIGKTLVKVEFWRVTSEYLAKYPVALRSPIKPGEMVSRISNPVPAATLETAFADKLTAFATRPYLKWRDIYDLWWIGTQTDARLEVSAVARQFLHNVSAYQTIGDLPPAQALRAFLQKDSADLVKKADPDLKRWVPRALWEKLHPKITTEMVRYAKYTLQAIAEAVETGTSSTSLKTVPHD